MKEAKLVGVKTGPMQQEFLTWTFSDVLVSGYQIAAGAGDVPMDQVTFSFSRIRVEYKAQKADGSLDSPIVAGWDKKAIKKL